MLLRSAYSLGVILVAVLTARAQPIMPEPLPDPRIPGFQFPESEAAITGWIAAMTRALPAAPVGAANIHLHGWGLWTALTAETTQVYAGQALRVFETWRTPDELASVGLTPSAARVRARTPLGKLAQLGLLEETTDGRAALDEGSTIGRVMGFVKFDPTAAAHITSQQLLSRAALSTLLDAGAQQVPAFPATALVVKPVFQVITAKDLLNARYYPLKIWRGPPETPQAWAPSQWPGTGWIDVYGAGRGNGAVDEVAEADGSSRTEENTYPISSLINYRLSAADAAAVNHDKPGTDAAAGDFAILVAMHVSGREIARWTWHTFWWTPTPDDPREPSSVAIARRRPPQLRGAARNYAMALAYTMLTPDQPYVGGENSGVSVYAYNPWIEARLGPAELPDSLPGSDGHGGLTANNFGVQSNCMSCHARANYNPNLRATVPRFSGARYTDLGDAKFVGTLQVDFLWSLARHAQ